MKLIPLLPCFNDRHWTVVQEMLCLVYIQQGCSQVSDSAKLKMRRRWTYRWGWCKCLCLCFYINCATYPISHKSLLSFRMALGSHPSFSSRQCLVTWPPESGSHDADSLSTGTKLLSVTGVSLFSLIFKGLSESGCTCQSGSTVVWSLLTLV